MSTLAFTYDLNGVVNPHSYGDDDYPLPPNEVLCTAAQFQNPSLWQVVNGALVQSLLATQTQQISVLRVSYATANAAPISFTNAAGVADTYQCDPVSLSLLNHYITSFRTVGIVLSGFLSSGKVPADFYWRSFTNKNNSFTYSDLVNLNKAVALRRSATFVQLQSRIAQVSDAKTVYDVRSIIF